MDRDAMIAGIYAAAAGKGDWRAALAPLSAALGLWSFQLIAVDKRRGTLVFAEDCGGVGPKVALDYFRYYHAINPRVPPSLAMACGDWFHDHQHFDDAFVAGHPFYQDYLIPNGGRHLSGTKLVDSDALVVLFGAMRGVGSPPLDDAELRFLESMRLHFTEASHIYLETRHLNFELAAARRLIDPIPHPVFVVDARLNLGHQNLAAQVFLARDDCLGVDAGVLGCRHPRDRHALDAALRRIVGDAGGGEATPERAVFRLRGAGTADVFACLTRLRQDSGINVFGASHALLMLYDRAAHGEAIDGVMLSEIFGLTPAETEVAIGISLGESLERLAEGKRISINTVRSHLQKVFEKTGVSKQLELARLVLSFPPKALLPSEHPDDPR